MSIKTLMTTSLVTVNVDDTLTVVKDIFDTATFHHILVLENDKLVGVISDRDYFKSIGPRLGTPIETERDRMPLNKKAHQIMNRKLATVKENASMFDLVSCFQEHKVSCIPVVNDDGGAIGIISWRDIMAELANQMLKKYKVE